MIKFENNTPISSQFDDIYFSPEDGMAETRHVFIDGNNLNARFRALRPQQIFTIAETGFGTGLNCLIAAQEFLDTAPETAELFIYSFEQYPLSIDEIKTSLNNFSTQFQNLFDTLIDQYPLRVGGWHKIILHSRVTLILIFDDMNHAIPLVSTPIDAWFLDGFAPSKNPSMWSDILFSSMARLSHQHTTASTFTSAGLVRRGLESSNFHVTKTKGFGRKREMICANFKGINEYTRIKNTPQNIAILGAGLAGLNIAHLLHRDEHMITIFESHSVASQASGNPCGLYNPRFTSQRDHHAEFYASAFSRAYNQFKTISKSDNINFNPCGAFHFITDDDKQKRFQNCLSSWSWHESEATILSANEISNRTEFTVTHDALFLNYSGSVSPKLYCETLVKPFVKPFKIKDKSISSITESNSGWMIDGEYFDIVIYAGGVLGRDLISALPLQSVRGQVTFATLNSDHKPPRHCFCYGGYMAPISSNELIIGSSFQPWLTESNAFDQDNTDNINKAVTILPSLKNSVTITGSRVGFRSASKDRFPIAGKYKYNFYVSTAHGSHGLISSLASADYLYSLISNTPNTMPDSVLQALSPSRFEKQTNHAK
jgi:tRNA 5-methylaminomethyl-2-thiouridine biosynthesis bifunctional protein